MGGKSGQKGAAAAACVSAAQAPGMSSLTAAADRPHLPMRPLVFAAFLGTMAMMAFVGVIGPVVRELALPEWVAGAAVTTGGMLWMALARAWGRLSDRRGRNPVLLIGFAAFALTYLLLA